MSKSPYTGSQIDEALRKASTMRIVNNGWILLESSETKPIDLNTLINPGNYSVNYWTNGPGARNELGYPASVTVLNIANVLYQFFTIGSTSYNRKSGEGNQDFGTWNIDQSTGAMNPGPDAPSSPVDGKTTWLDTSSAANPTFKLFLNGEWVEIIPTGLMQAVIYDPSGRRTDIFAYIDNEIAKLDPTVIEMDFASHIEDHTIHVTADEKNKWNTNATIENITSKIQELGPAITIKTEEIVGDDITKIDELTNDLSNFNASLNEHASNSEIHPTLQKQNEWDSKAAGDHQHYLDGNVKITVDDIEGEIGDDLIPFNLKERAYIVASDEERLKLKYNPVHNGDAICVTEESGDKWYFVLREELLGQYDTEMSDQITIRELGRDWVTETIDNVYWRSVAYNGNLYVAVPRDEYDWAKNKFGYSIDGINWTINSVSLSSYRWFNIVYGKDKFIVSAGSSGRSNDISNTFAYSTDGINWSETSSGLSIRNWRGLEYADSKFVTISTFSNFMAYSTDGIIWTEASFSSETTGFQSLVYGNNKFVAVSYRYRVIYSTDGIMWTDSLPNIDLPDGYDGFVTIGFCINRFISTLVGPTDPNYAGNICMYSYDGLVWTLLYPNIQKRYWHCIQHLDTMCVLSDNNSNSFVYSNDGINWIEIELTPKSTSGSTHLCYGNGKIIAPSSRRIYYSTDETIVKFVAGVDWSTKTIESLPMAQWTAMEISNISNTIVAISSNTNTVAYSTDGGDTWQTTSNNLSNREWIDICYSNDKFVMIAANSNTFAYSSDGITWTETSNGLPSQEWSAITYANGKFVAISKNSNTFAYSSDGITWETTTSGIPQDLEYLDIAYGVDKFFVAIKNANAVLYSSDGIAWNSTNDGITTRDWFKACYGNGRYVLIAKNSDTFAYSNNGIRWYETTVGISGDNMNWSDVVYGGNGRFVVISSGENSRVIYSLDGYYWNESKWENLNKDWNCIVWNSNANTYMMLNTNDNTIGISRTEYKEYINTEAGKDWITYDTKLPSFKWISICYGNGKYVVVPNDNDTFAYSTDGITWTETNNGLSVRNWWNVCYGNGKFVAIAQAYNNDTFAYSTDGITWTETNNGISAGYCNRICYGNDKYVVSRSTGHFLIYSTDGITWTETNNGISDRHWYAICYGDNKYVVMTYNSNYSAYSTDGITWTETNNGLSVRNWRGLVYGDTKYVAVAYNSNTFAYSTDGITWTETSSGLGYREWVTVCYGDDKYIVTSNTTDIFAYSTDGITWTETNNGIVKAAWRGVCYGDDKYVAVSAYSNMFTYSMSGIENFPLPDPYSPPAEKAYKQVLSRVSSINWQNVSNTPTTLAGYGITDAASDEDLEKISQEISEVRQNIPSDVDLSKAIEAQTTYNELLTNLSIIDSIFSTLDSTIASLESVVS